MTEPLRCRYCHRKIADNPLNRRFQAGHDCMFRHGSRADQELRSAMAQAHGTLQLPGERSVTAEELHAAAHEWLELGADHPVARRYVEAAMLIAELHDLPVPSSSN